jgi:2-(1,2-epoxy-1,2-dihydrophenyl)acetyl-CoA isomerase
MINLFSNYMIMSSVLFEIQQDIAFITLNRPEKFNAFNREMALLLQEILHSCSIDKHIRCVYITGAGKAFCAGQDLGAITGDGKENMESILREQFNPIINQIRNLNKPVIAAVNGVAAGAGANIALCCDIVVASEGASFIQAFSKIGLIPDSSGTYFLPRLIGWQKASALMMLGEKVLASEAARMGMIYKVFPADQFEEASREIAATLAVMPTMGLAYTKQALNASFSNTLDEQLQTEDRLQLAASQTYDYQEGVTAFMEKRPAIFKGE